MDKKTLKKLEDLGAKAAKGEVPEEVKAAVEELQKSVASSSLPFWKALSYKDGKFSKTALFASIGNVVVLLMYVGQELFSGAMLSVGSFDWTIPGFDPAAAAMILAILNGTYLGNNVVKGKASKEE